MKIHTMIRIKSSAGFAHVGVLVLAVVVVVAVAGVGARVVSQSKAATPYKYAAFMSQEGSKGKTDTVGVCKINNTIQIKLGLSRSLQFRSEFPPAHSIADNGTRIIKTYTKGTHFTYRKIYGKTFYATLLTAPTASTNSGISKSVSVASIAACK